MSLYDVFTFTAVVSALMVASVMWALSRAYCWFMTTGIDQLCAYIHYRTTRLKISRRPRRIILIRHGQSVGNDDKSVYAHIPDNRIPLTQLGMQQAEDGGDKLKRLVQDESVLFYVSPFLRSKQTFDGIVRSFPREQYRVREDPRIREQEWGNLQDPTSMERILAERSHVGRFYYRFSDGESGADVFDRVSSFMESLFRELMQDSPAQNVVLISHGLFIRLFLMRFFRWTVDQYSALWNPSNGQFIILERDEPFGSYVLKTKLKHDRFIEGENNNSKNATNNGHNEENHSNGDESLHNKPHHCSLTPRNSPGQVVSEEALTPTTITLDHQDAEKADNDTSAANTENGTTTTVCKRRGSQFSTVNENGELVLASDSGSDTDVIDDDDDDDDDDDEELPKPILAALHNRHFVDTFSPRISPRALLQPSPAKFATQPIDITTTSADSTGLLPGSLIRMRSSSLPPRPSSTANGSHAGELHVQTNMSVRQVSSTQLRARLTSGGSHTLPPPADVVKHAVSTPAVLLSTNRSVTHPNLSSHSHAHTRAHVITSEEVKPTISIPNE